MQTDTSNDEHEQREAEQDAAYEAMLDQHIAAIEAAYGKKAAQNANIGWGSGPADICSKVYGHGYVSTYYDPETYAVLRHEAEDM